MKDLWKELKRDFKNAENQEINDLVEKKIEEIKSLLKDIRSKGKVQIVFESKEIVSKWNEINLTENEIREWYISGNFKDRINVLKIHWIE